MTLGATPDPYRSLPSDLLFGSRSVEGALTGNPATGDATLKFCMLAGVAAMIETMLLEQAPQAYAQMMAGKARFRMERHLDCRAGRARRECSASFSSLEKRH
jgi:propanol-preferring alcohol dehydrogenase